MMKTIFSAAILCIFVLTGCISVQYNGVSEAPLPSNAPVAIYYAKDQIKSEYRVIGTGTYSASPNTTRAEIQKIFRDAARTHGANAILITSLERVPDYVAREDQVNNQNAPSWNVTDNSNTATSYAFNTIYYATGSDPEKTIYKTFVKAEFLVIKPYLVTPEKK